MHVILSCVDELLYLAFIINYKSFVKQKTPQNMRSFLIDKYNSENTEAIFYIISNQRTIPILKK